MTALLALALLAAPWAQLSQADRAEKVAQLRKQPLSERLVAVSAGFLGTTYVLSPLGEGTGRDPDPLIRYDAVDCLTLVEETMAMALAPDGPSLVPVLSRLRYSGDPAWETRNHLMEAQWIPKNVERGLVRDVTRQYGGADVLRVVKRLTPKTWEEKAGQALALPKAAQSLGEFGLDILPAEKVLGHAAKIPSGTIAVVVRADRPWLITRISHVGFLVQTSKGPVLRHASRSFGKVTDEPLARFLTRNLKYGRWTIEGLALFEVTEPVR